MRGAVQYERAGSNLRTPANPFSEKGHAMGSHQSDRRQFLTESAALASLAVGAVQSVGAQAPAAEAKLKDPLAYGQPSRFDNTVRKSLGSATPITDTALTTPLHDLDGIITP